MTPGEVAAFVQKLDLLSRFIAWGGIAVAILLLVEHLIWMRTRARFDRDLEAKARRILRAGKGCAP